MQWASKVSEEFNLKDAMAECIASVQKDLNNVKPDLAVVFVSPHHTPEFSDIPRVLAEKLGPRVLIGCSAGGVIGGGKEVEDRTAFALTGAVMPGVDLTGFHVDEMDLPDMDAGPATWERIIGVQAATNPNFIVLVDPFTIRGENLLAGLDYAFPLGVKVGGLASGASQPGQTALFMGDTLYFSGAVGLSVSGNLRVDAVVAQGCRPVGPPMAVTKCERNLLQELDGMPPMDVLREIYEKAGEHDRVLIQQALHLGVSTDPLKEVGRPGDFLMRNVLGLHQESKALVIGELLHEGQLVQFHLRDAQSAEEDLSVLLRRYSEDSDFDKPSGALLFQCVGRGANLFGRPDHDPEMFKTLVGPSPIGGFFCQGEIGPVGSNTYLHGFTSSFAIFRPK